CEEVTADFRGHAADKELALEFKREEIRGIILGNTTSLRILLENILDNAIQYTPAGGRIQVRVLVGNEIELIVEDNGPGILAAERERVFSPFYRTPGSCGNGSGLGLSIVKRVAERHQASVIIEDSSWGKGLRVRVCFPRNIRLEQAA